jgi:hypothetical protein
MEKVYSEKKDAVKKRMQREKHGYNSGWKNDMLDISLY